MDRKISFSLGQLAENLNMNIMQHGQIFQECIVKQLYLYAKMGIYLLFMAKI
uniref:Uncharacterized protein n=1 Tax=Meloidogyne enterolobii TaxID=390850 RepID=A0A6V7VAU6_MELEN|nr:unnamed protein product [Meloidogyne enterolobii]